MKPKTRFAFPSSRNIALALIALPSVAQAITWGGTGPGALTGNTNDTAHQWNQTANWTGAVVPNAVGAVADVTADFTGATTLYLNGGITTGTLNLNDTGASGDVVVTIAGGTGSPLLTFDNTASTNAVLTSAGATNVISANILLNDSLDITTTNSLTLSGLISSSGTQNLTKATTAGNTLTLTNNLNSYTGTTSIANGTLAVTLNGDVALSADSVLGNSATAIIHGTSASNANSAISFNAGNDSSNYTLSRGIDFSQGAGTSTASVNFNSDGAGVANTNTLTLAGNLTIDDTRSASLRAQRAGMTINVTGNIIQVAGTTGLGLNTFSSSPGADGRGAGTVRFSSLARNYVGANNLIMGSVLIDGTVGALATPSPIGQTTINLSQGSGGNLVGGANFNGNTLAVNDTSVDTIRSVFLESAGSSFARILSPGTGTNSGPAQTTTAKLPSSYVSNVGVINGYQFGGRNGSGSVTFGGAIAPQDVDVGNSTTNPIHVAVNMALIAETGGTTVFNGAISDTPTALTEARLTINQFRNHPNIDGYNNTSAGSNANSVGNFVSGSIGADGIADVTANQLVGNAKTGTVQLNAANSHVGTTEVLGGVLQIGNSNALGFGGRQALGTGTTTVASGAVLDLNGQTSVNEPIILNGTGISSGGALINNSANPASIRNGLAGIQLGTITGTGSGYSTAPTITVSGTGSGATATASLGLTQASINSASGGTGWVTGDVVNISGNNGSGATAIVTASGGAITGLTLSRPGSGFTGAPTTINKNDSLAGAGILTFSGNATNFAVTGLNLTAAGSGYTGTPTFSFGSGNAVAGTTTLSSVTLASDSSIGGTGSITIDAVISEAGGARSLSKVGTGNTTLTGTNTYTGATNVSVGKLVINGNISTSALVTASGTGTLAGSGTVGAASVTSGGTLAIGNSAGTMNFSSLSLDTSSTFLYELTGGLAPSLGSADLGEISGDLTISTGAILDLVQLGAYTAGNRFTLFAYDGLLNGNFNGLLDGATFTDAGGEWMIDYDDALAGLNGGVSASNTYVTITAIPEPGAALLVSGFGVLALLRRRRLG